MVRWLRLIPIGIALGGVAAGGMAPSVADLVAVARPKVMVLRATGPRPTVGTAFLAEDGLLLTAHHVIRGGRAWQVHANGAPYAVAVMAADADRDVAVLGFSERRLWMKPLRLGASDSLHRGEELLVLTTGAARPGARAEPEERLAIPARFAGRSERRSPTGVIGPHLDLVVAVARGDSGAPVLRLADGVVVGFLTSRALPDEEGISRTAYAIPIETARPLLAQARAAARATEFYLLPLARP